MSKTLILLSCFGFILLSLMATNPDSEDYRQEMRKKVLEKIDKADLTNPEINIDSILSTIERDFSRENMILFSTAQVRINGSIQPFAYGLFGSVRFFDSDLDQIRQNFETALILLKSDLEMAARQKREKLLRSFQGNFIFSTDFYTNSLHIVYLGNNSYQFSLYNGAPYCNIFNLSGIFVMSGEYSGTYMSSRCGKITFDFSDLVTPKSEKQPVVLVRAQNESCMGCDMGEGAWDVPGFGEFWRP